MKKRIASFIIAMLFLLSSSTVLAYENDEGIEIVLPDGLRMVALTDEARAIALSDFDYLADMILQTAPTVNIVYRRLGITMEDLLAQSRQSIYDKTPIPSLTALLLGEDWIEEPEEPLELAADYLKSLLTLMAVDLGGLGHFSPLDALIYEQLFIGAAIIVNNAELLLELGMTQANLDFIQLHYDIYSTPATVRLFGVNPEDFNLDADALGDVGLMNEDNVTTYIIEPGRIAYLRIASFMNSIVLDMETIFLFFEQIQDYEHLIIDVRGNMGGLANYFTVMLMMLIDEAIQFQYPEFYIGSELTAGFYENPLSMAGGELYGKFTAAEFVQERNMLYFNQDDLELLDYVLVWQTDLPPLEDNTPFAGEIWLLVDGMSMSASEIAAKISVNTGFATVVGEPTAGVTGVIHTFASLPNTGVLFRIDLGYTVDNYGRSIEEFGVIPQIANMPELDALQTVLTLIAAPSATLNTSIYLDDEDTGVSGVIFTDRTLISVASVADIFESAQLNIDNWQAILLYGDTRMILSINSNEAYVNDTAFTMPQPLQIVNGEIFVPLRFIAENFGYDVDFYNYAVVIFSNE